MLAPDPGLAVPAVATVQLVPPLGLQSVRVKVAAVLAGSAAIFSRTVWASIVPLVSPLERLLFMIAVLKSTASPAMPMASTVIAIINSTSENPPSARLPNRTRVLRAKFEVVVIAPATKNLHVTATLVAPSAVVVVAP